MNTLADFNCSSVVGTKGKGYGYFMVILLSHQCNQCKSKVQCPFVSTKKKFADAGEVEGTIYFCSSAS